MTEAGNGHKHIMNLPFIPHVNPQSDMHTLSRPRFRRMQNRVRSKHQHPASCPGNTLNATKTPNTSVVAHLSTSFSFSGRFSLSRRVLRPSLSRLRAFSFCFALGKIDPWRQPSSMSETWRSHKTFISETSHGIRTVYTWCIGECFIS